MCIRDSLHAHSSISLSIPAKDMELSTEADSSTPLCRQIQFDQGYYLSLIHI